MYQATNITDSKLDEITELKQITPKRGERTPADRSVQLIIFSDDDDETSVF